MVQKRPYLVGKVGVRSNLPPRQEEENILVCSIACFVPIGLEVSVELQNGNAMDQSWDAGLNVAFIHLQLGWAGHSEHDLVVDAN